MPSDVCLAVDIYSSKWRIGDPPCGMDMPLDVIQVEFLRCSGVGAVEGVAPSIEPLSSLHICGAGGVTQT